MTSPQLIGRYQIQEIIGQGSMGSVYKAYDPTLNRMVAIKTVNTHLRKSQRDAEEFKARFFREAQTSSQLSHPNIIGIFDMGIHYEEPFLVMEFVDGLSLEDLLRDRTHFSRAHQFALLTQLAQGLDHAHQQGYVHRDIKPANFLVGRNGQAKIVDFGLARFQDSNLTTSGMFVGTPSYASPEQIQPGEIQASSDVFSFGIVAFEVLFGRRPFPGDNISTILYQIVHESPDFQFGYLEPELDPEALERAFGKFLAKAPQYRPKHCMALVHELALLFHINPMVQPDWAPLFQNPGQGERPLSTPSNPSGGIHYDETIAIGDHSGDWSNASRIKWPLGGKVLLGAFALICAGLVVYGLVTQPQTLPKLEPSGLTNSFDPPPLVIDANTPPAPDLETHLKINALSQLHDAFWNQVMANDLKTAAATLLSYREAGATQEQIAPMEGFLNRYKNLTRETVVETKSENARGKILQTFKEAHEAGDLGKMRAAMADFTRRRPDDTATYQLLKGQFDEVQLKQENHVATARSGLEKAYAAMDPDLAREYVSQLSEVGALSKADRQLYSSLTHRVFTDAYGIKFVRIPKGNFIMGLRKSTNGQGGPEKLEKVEIPQDLFFSAFEITLNQYSQIVGGHNQRYIGDAIPVADVSWYKAQEFVQELNRKEGQDVYRLPSMAEWEYACRAGTSQLYHFGFEMKVDFANSSLNGLGRPMQVGSFPANAWGLYDMHGNVWEWCDNQVGTEIWLENPEKTQASGFLANNRASLRGGAFDSTPIQCAAGFPQKRWRIASPQNVGIRLVRTSKPESVAITP